MARFVYWSSGLQVGEHILYLQPQNQSSYENVAVAECGDDLMVQLVNKDGGPSTGSANLNEKARRGSICQAILKNVKDGDKVLVKIKGTETQWSVPLTIRVVARPVITASTLPTEPCPAVRELTNVLRETIPFLADTYLERSGSEYTPKAGEDWHKTSGVKQYNRLQWQSGSPLDRHMAGLALDIILWDTNPQERALGHHLFKTFLEYKHRMNWLGLIYQRVTVNNLGHPIPYNDNEKHKTHIHIDWLIFGDVTWEEDKAHHKKLDSEGKPIPKTIPWPRIAFTTGFK
jgi:hypothetical protein